MVRTLFIGVITVFVLLHISPAQESGGVRLLSHYVPPEGGSYVAGCWGWTDTVSGKEYALLGSYSGTSIVEITDADNPVERDFVPGPSSTWRELQTHSHYAYVVTEGGGGVQIIDLSYLPDSVHLVQSFNYSQGGKNISSSHTNHIKDGYLYLNGCSNWPRGGAVIFNLADPENPTFEGEYSERYYHDSFARNDTLFGAAIYDGGIDIVDVSNKSNPIFITRFNYTGAGTHNCATTSDGRYLLTTDEIGTTAKTLKIWDIQHLPTVTKVAEYQGNPTAIVHNVFVKDTLAYMSYYTAGLKILNIADPTHPVEVGGFDTYPNSDIAAYTGAWSTYPFFPSGKIIIGDMETGLYIVDINPNAPRTPTFFRAYSDFQTPSSATMSWVDPTEIVSGTPLTDFSIHIYRDGIFIAEVDSGVQQYTDSGLVLHQAYRYSVRAVSATDSSSATGFTVYAGGHAQPKPPTSFDVTSIDAGAKISWITPSQQLDGTPLNDLAFIDIYRNNALIGTVNVNTDDTASYGEYIDSTSGYHTYTILSRDNETPNNTSSLTEPIFDYAGSVSSSYSENFDSGLSSVFHTGDWDTTHAISVSGNASITDSPEGFYPTNSSTYFLLPPLRATANHVLSFKQIGTIGLGDFGFVEGSTDNKTFTRLYVAHSSYHAEWKDSSADSGDWFPQTVSLSRYAGDTVYLRFLLVTDASRQMDGWYIDDITVASTVGVEEESINTPAGISLEQNFPNPFNPTTNFGFRISDFGFVTLKVFDVLGREAVVLLNEEKSPGKYSVQWDAQGVPSGVYFYQLEVNERDGTHAVQRKKLIILR
ncbi:MAG: choice-of-anchor B family protein [Ignavibacteriae bacterium]|nr:choice-of-anchor B family protein [Ignavibacteriota bacterium]